MARRKSKEPAPLERPPIVIDQKRNWIFKDENDLLKHFEPTIEKLNQEFAGLHQSEDFDLTQFKNPARHLQETLLNPDQVWKDEQTSKEFPVYIYIKNFKKRNESYWYVVTAYLTDNRPSFIFSHFPTKIQEMMETYRRTQLAYDINSEPLEFVDALAAQDPLALGLYEAMLKLRSDHDISVDQFTNETFQEARVQTLDRPDEIWKMDAPTGPHLVKFIKRFKSEKQSFWYVVITAEESSSGSHYVLFSFPTTDASLVERYRYGEQLEVGEFVREESH